MDFRSNNLVLSCLGFRPIRGPRVSDAQLFELRRMYLQEMAKPKRFSQGMTWILASLRNPPVDESKKRGNHKPRARTPFFFFFWSLETEWWSGSAKLKPGAFEVCGTRRKKQVQNRNFVVKRSSSSWKLFVALSAAHHGCSVPEEERQ